MTIVNKQSCSIFSIFSKLTSCFLILNLSIGSIPVAFANVPIEVATSQEAPEVSVEQALQPAEELTVTQSTIDFLREDSVLSEATIEASSEQQSEQRENTTVISGTPYQPAVITSLPYYPVLETTSGSTGESADGTIQQEQLSGRELQIDYALQDFDDFVASELNWGVFENEVFQGLPQDLSQGITVAARVTGNASDLDGDGDVDMSDFGALQICFGATDTGCQRADLNRDGVINSNDVSVMQSCMSGPSITASPACRGNGQLEVQFVDYQGHVASAYLVLTGDMQNFEVDLASIAAPEFDAANVAQIRWVADRMHLGSEGLVLLEIDHLQYHPTVTVRPELDSLDLFDLPTGFRVNSLAHIEPYGAQLESQLTRRGANISYDTGSAGYVGAGFGYSYQGQLLNWPGNELRFGIKQVAGGVDRIKVEVKGETYGTFYIEGLEPGAEQIVSIPFDLLQGRHDVINIQNVVFVIEGFGLEGEMEINYGPAVPPSTTLTTADIRPLPLPSHIGVAGFPGGTLTKTARGNHLTYDTTWSSYAQIVYTYGALVDLRGSNNQYQDIQIGIKGSPRRIKVEISDDMWNTDFVYLSDVSPDHENVYSIPLDQFKNVNLDRVRQIFFTVEEEYDQIHIQGELTVNRLPGFVPSDGLTPADITPVLLSEKPNLGSFARDDGSLISLNQTSPDTFDLHYEGVAESSFGGAFVPLDPYLDGVDLTQMFPEGKMVFQASSADQSLGTVVLEIKDASGRQEQILIDGLTSEAALWQIPLDAFSFVDLSQVVQIAFVLNGTGTKNLNVTWGEYAWTPLVQPLPTYEMPTQLPLTSEGTPVHVTPFAGGTEAEATVEVISPTFLAIHYDAFSDDSYGGIFMNYDYGQSPDAEVIDLAVAFPDGIILNMDSPNLSVSHVKLEVVDENDNRDYVMLSGIMNYGQSWEIPVDLFDDVNVHSIKTVSLVLTGSADNALLYVDWGRFDYDPAFGADPALTEDDVTPIQGVDLPVVFKFNSTDFSGNDSSIEFSRLTEDEMNMIYQGPSPESFAGTVIQFDVPYTSETETVSLAQLFPDGNFVLEMSSPDLDRVKLEVTDAAGNRDHVYLQNIQDAPGRWQIPIYAFDEIDINAVREIIFVIEGQGEHHLDIRWGHYDVQTVLNPSDVLTAEDIIPLPGAPGITQVDGANSESLVTATERGIKFDYFVTQSFTGAGFSFDNFGTPEIETADLTGFDDLRFGIKNTGQTQLDSIKFEVVDRNEKRATVQLRGITIGEEKIYSIPIEELSRQGVDLSQARLIYFVVAVNEGTKAGTLEINRLPSIPVNIAPSQVAPADIVPLPEDPYPQIAGARPDDAEAASSWLPRGNHFEYDTKTGGWAAGGFTYDDFGTPEIETVDLSGYDQLMFGLKGTPTEVKFEIIDDQDRKAVVHLKDILPNEENVYVIRTSLLDSIDLSKVRLIYFVVEGQQQAGELDIYRNPLDLPATLDPSVFHTAADINIHNTPWYVIQTSPNDVGLVQATPDGIYIDYSRGKFIYSGSGGWTYDNPATAEVETADLSSLDEVVFGLKGMMTGDPTPALVVTDVNGNQFRAELTGLNATTEKFWAVPQEYFSGIDMSQIKSITFSIGYAYNVTGSTLYVHTYEPRTFTVHPGESLQAAIDLAHEGDTILLKAGFHHLPNNILKLRKGIHIIGENPDTTQIIVTDVDSYGYKGADRVTMENVTLTGFSRFGSTIEGDQMVFRNVNLTGSVAQYGGRIEIRGSGNELINVNVNVMPLEITGSHNLLSRVLIAPYVDASGTASGLILNGDKNTVVNGTFYVHAAANATGVHINGTLNLINNAIVSAISDNTEAKGVVVGTGKQNLIQYSLIDSKAPLHILSIEGNIKTGPGMIYFKDPLFVDPANRLFQLKAGSPAINAGDPSLLDPDGSRSDIGKYYFEVPALAVETVRHDRHGNDFGVYVYEVYTQSGLRKHVNTFHITHETSADFTFTDSYVAPSRRIVTVSLEGDTEASTVVIDVATGDRLWFSGSVIEASYDGNLAHFTVREKDGTQKTVNVELISYQIVRKPGEFTEGRCSLPDISTSVASRSCVGIIGTPGGNREVHYYNTRGNTGLHLYDPVTQGMTSYSIPALYIGPNTNQIGQNNFSPDGKFMSIYHQQNQITVLALSGNVNFPKTIGIPQVEGFGVPTVGSVEFISGTQLRAIISDGTNRHYLIEIDEANGLQLSLEVPEGWRTVASNPYKAYQIHTTSQPGDYFPTTYLNLLDLNTGQVQEVHSLQSYIDRARFTGFVDVSPDSERIVYEIEETRGGQKQVYIRSLADPDNLISVYIKHAPLEKVEYLENKILIYTGAYSWEHTVSGYYDVNLITGDVVFYPDMPDGWTRAASNPNFAFRMERAGYTIQRPGSDVQIIYLRNLLTGDETRAWVSDHPANLDVTPDGKYATHTWYIPEGAQTPFVIPQSAFAIYNIVTGTRTHVAIEGEVLSYEYKSSQFAKLNVKKPDGTVQTEWVDIIHSELLDVSYLDSQTVIIPAGVGRAEMYYLADKNVLLYQTTVNSNNQLVIENLTTGAVRFQSVPNFGWSGIKAVSPDRSFVIAASSVNAIYAIPIDDVSTESRFVNVPVAAGEGPTGYVLQSVEFYASNYFKGTLANGNEVYVTVTLTQLSVTTQIKRQYNSEGQLTRVLQESYYSDGKLRYLYETSYTNGTIYWQRLIQYDTAGKTTYQSYRYYYPNGRIRAYYNYAYTNGKISSYDYYSYTETGQIGVIYRLRYNTNGQPLYYDYYIYENGKLVNHYHYEWTY